ncbi:MAG TPA: hypothetical protein DCS30_00530 [Rhizobiales bacterium]|nr:hypothetical protein [Hyphomicrobiales bacterium]
MPWLPLAFIALPISVFLAIWNLFWGFSTHVAILQLVFLFFAIPFLVMRSLQYESWYPLAGFCLIVFTPLSMIAGGAAFFMEYGLVNNLEKDATLSWFETVYFSVVTFTTLGYGDFSPTQPSRVGSLLLAFGGYLYSGYVIGFLFHVANVKREEEDDES